jgi:hypothetical protein
VTAFVIESYKKLQPDSTDAFLLRISSQLAATDTATPLPAPFEVTRAPVLCNICWFLSLVLSLGCPLGAIPIRQWVLNYLQHSRDASTPARKVRMRQYLFDGVEKWKMAEMVELLPAILHFSLFLLGVGLIAFLLEANMAVMITVAVVGSLGLAAYATFTVHPIFWPECPYQTPLSVPCLILFPFVMSAWKSTRHQGKKSPGPPKLRERRTHILGD